MGSSVHNGTDRDAAETPRQQEGALEAIFEEYVERINQGEALNSTEVRARYPHLAGELIERLEMFELIDESSGGDGDLGTLADYTLLSRIGRGGMGVVYEAWENSMDRRVALKVLPPGIAADTHTVTRFAREARVAGNLQHPHVVPVFAMGIKDNTPYYAMELVEGETLAQILGRSAREGEGPREKTPFGEKGDVRYFANIAEAFADVADGVQHAHSRGVVHRDIKPSNLMLEGEGRLRLLDFGLARLEGQESLTLTGDFVGTPAYMSPEQARRQKVPVDHRTDIYSLGATLYEMLTHRQPFRGKDPQDTISQIIEHEPRSPRQLNPRVPADLETIVLKCLRKEPGDRYGTAEALGQDLRRFVRGEPIEARPEAKWDQAARRLWKHRFALGGIVALLLLSTLGLAVGNLVIARARDEARYDLYVSQMRMAMQDWDSGSYRRFVDLLDPYAEGAAAELRGWEWYYLQSLKLTARPEFSLEADSGGALCVVDWSDDGRFLATGGSDGSIKVWDAETRELVRVWKNEDRVVKRIAWSPVSTTGHQLGAGLSGSIIKLFDLSDEAELAELRGKNFVWAPDGARLALFRSKDGPVSVWDPRGGLELQLLDARPGRDKLSFLAWSPDGRRLAAALEWPAEIVVWETDDWRSARFSAHLSYVSRLAWSPDGTRLASSGHDQRIHLWDASAWDGEPEHTVDATVDSAALAWVPDATKSCLAAAGRDGIVRIWDFASGAEPMTIRGHAGRVSSVAWNPEGRLLATGSHDGTVRVWDTAEHQGESRLAGESPAVWTPDGRWLAMDRGDSAAMVLDAETLEVMATLPVGQCAMAFSPDSRLLALSEAHTPVNHVVVWDWRRDVRLHSFPGTEHTGHGVAWSPDGRLLAVGEWTLPDGRGGACVLWDVTTGEKFRTVIHAGGGAVKAVAWSPDGSRLALTSLDQLLTIWDTNSWEEVQRLWRHPARIPGEGRADLLDWSPDGTRLAAGNSGGEVVVWDTASWERLYAASGHSAGVLSVSWSPDGTRLASGGADRAVKIWDAGTGEELLTLHGHNWSIWAVDWHPDGQRLMSADNLQDSLRVWDAGPGYEAK